MEEIADFLVRFPPFGQLARDDLLHVAEAVIVRSYSAGTDILIEDGPPATTLFVIRSGSVELRHQDEVVDILEPGETFGRPSLLTGMAAAFTVRAHEDTTCYLIGREAALEVLGRPAGAIFVARTMRERLIRTGHTVHGLPEVRTIRIGNLIAAPPVLCRPDRTIREAASLMSAERVSGLFVSAAGELGIVTDTDFRQKVVAGGVSPEAPISTIMSRPLLTVRADRFALDAALDMLCAGVQHLVVTDARDAVMGLVSAGDLMGLAYLSPFALRAAIFNAPSEPALDAVTKDVAKDVNAGLARAGFGPDISGVVAGNTLWRMSESQWVQTFRDCLDSPDLSHLVRAVVSFDFRHVAGGLEVTPPLVTVLRDTPAHPGFLARLAQITTYAPPALPHRFFAWLWQPQEVDLKKGGIVPIANLARFHALANGITISPTLDRLVAAEELGALNKETAQSLREAFAFIWQVRLDHHAQQIRAGLPPDNLIRPDQLPPLARKELREAFRAIAAAQQQLNRFVPLGI